MQQNLSHKILEQKMEAHNFPPEKKRSHFPQPEFPPRQGHNIQPHLRQHAILTKHRKTKPSFYVNVSHAKQHKRPEETQAWELFNKEESERG